MDAAGRWSVTPETAAQVVVIDDHPAVLAGVRVWCAAADPPIGVVAAGADIAAAWVEPGRSAPVVVLDLYRGGVAPAYTDLRRLVGAGRQVVVYSMRDDSRTALTCLELGAATYLRKTESSVHLVAAIHAAVAGRPYVSPSLARVLDSANDTSRPLLTPRELDVLLLWFQCESKDTVATKLGLSTRTVAGYIDRVRIKYANTGRPARTKAALVARAIQDGLVTADEL